MSPVKREELNRAKTKEWEKIINSGSMKVHVGHEARRVESEVGKVRTLQSRFVYTSDDGTPEGVLKARWCVKGYLDPDGLELQTATPTLSNEGFAVTLQLIASYKWEMVIADVEGAFLRGDNIERQKGRILVRLPPGGVPGYDEKETVCELVKPVYGLVDAPRLWWNSLTKTLRDQGLQQSALDNCVFYSRDAVGQVNGVIAFHVDDLLIGGTK